MKKPLTFVAIAALLGLAACKPPASDVSSWQYQLQGTVDQSVDADVFNIDGFDTPPATVAALNSAGRYTICYVSTSYEDWRPDAASFPPSVLGNPLDGWPGERWVDVRQLSVLLPIFEARAAMCAEKGFSGIEFDNVDGYTNSTGFPLTAAHQQAFNEALAQVAKDAGLSPGLKNDPDQVPVLVDDFQFAIVEECATYDECDAYAPFIAAGKPVFVVEYELGLAATCAVTDPLGFSGIVKDYDLFAAPWAACR